MRRLALFINLVFATAAVLAQESYDEGVHIYSHSGSPLLLQMVIPDPEQEITRVTVQSNHGLHVHEMPGDNDRDAVQISVFPFSSAGVFDTSVVTEYSREDGPTQEINEFTVGFIDFQFGRDNLQFGNNADYESVIGTYGEILAKWVEDRFGVAGPADLVPVIDYMYQFFGERSGRCYAFAGSEALYWHWPDLLPSYISNTHKLRGNNRRTQENMNFLQLDMAFDHFFSGELASVLTPDERATEGSHERIVKTAFDIMAAITNGNPAVVGLMGPQYHHAMLAYGFIHRPADGILDLLVANNWKSDQDLNFQSRNAETVRINLEPTEDIPTVQWFYVGGSRDHEIDRLFIVDVQKEYEHDQEVMHQIIRSRRERLSSLDRALVIVEGAKYAWLSLEDRKTGIERGRTYNEIDDVLYDRVKQTFRFEFPSSANVTLGITEEDGSRVLFYRPDTGTGELAWIRETDSPEGENRVTRTMDLQADEQVWVVRTDEDN